jgi:hypothetical protein
MLYCSSIRVAAFSAALLMDIASATAHDETKYPDLRGQWTANHLSWGFPSAVGSTRTVMANTTCSKWRRSAVRPCMPKALLAEPFAARMTSMSPTGMMASTSRMMPTMWEPPHTMNASTASPDTAVARLPCPFNGDTSAERRSQTESSL